MNIFLTGLGENLYPEDQPVISILHALFGALWRGLNGVIVPGFNFSFADVFLALFTAGLVGLIMKAVFSTFASHFTNGKIKGRASGKQPAGKDKEN